MTGEDDDSLELMPRAVRDKLDRVRIKVHLKDWQALALAERAQLRDLPCTSEEERERYAAVVEGLIARVTGCPAEKIGKP